MLPQHLTSVTVTLQLDPNCRVILYSIYDPTFGVQLQCCATLDKCYGNILYSIYDTTFGVQLQCFTTLDKFYRNTHNPPVIFMNVYNPPVIFLEKKKNVLSRTVEQCSLTAWFECIQPICDIIRKDKKTFRAELSDNVLITALIEFI